MNYGFRNSFSPMMMAVVVVMMMMMIMIIIIIIIIIIIMSYMFWYPISPFRFWVWPDCLFVGFPRILFCRRWNLQAELGIQCPSIICKLQLVISVVLYIFFLIWLLILTFFTLCSYGILYTYIQIFHVWYFVFAISVLLLWPLFTAHVSAIQLKLHWILTFNL
jgi:hypothetical protein